MGDCVPRSRMLLIQITFTYLCMMLIVSQCGAQSRKIFNLTLLKFTLDFALTKFKSGFCYNFALSFKLSFFLFTSTNLFSTNKFIQTQHLTMTLGD